MQSLHETWWRFQPCSVRWNSNSNEQLVHLCLEVGESETVQVETLKEWKGLWIITRLSICFYSMLCYSTCRVRDNPSDWQRHASYALNVRAVVTGPCVFATVGNLWWTGQASSLQDPIFVKSVNGSVCPSHHTRGSASQNLQTVGLVVLCNFRLGVQNFQPGRPKR